MKSRFSNGFALPAVLMSSIVMLIVMLAAVTSTVSSRVSLESQYYNQLSKTAGEAGVAYARACMAQNSGTPQWTDAKPLKPNTDCSGNQLSGFTCSDNSTDPRCSVSVINGNIITSFSVPVPLPDTTGAFTNISSNGSVALLRSSGGDVWRQYKNNPKTQAVTLGGSSELGWKQVATHNNHTCAIASNDQAYCWGNNINGQLGDNTTVSKSTPTAVNTSGALAGLTIKSISVGDNHTCAIASNDQAYCWGNNGNGRLGDNTTTQKLTPVAVNTSGALAGLTIKSISTGAAHTCVIASNNQAYCWGSNGSGQLGDNTTTQKLTPVAVNTSGALAGLTIKSISVGGIHTCVVASNDQAYCWGSNMLGQLGDNTTVSKSTPTAVNTSGALAGLTIKSISAGGFGDCVIASNDLAYCWGDNSSGQLGDNTTIQRLTPVAVNTSGVLAGLTIKSISVGNMHTCAVASNDMAYCWGINSGRLGDNTTTNKSIPTAVNISGVLAGLTIKSISLGSAHTCAIASNDQMYCWGDNSSGQLGDNSIINKFTPVGIDTSGALAGLTIKSISAGGFHACAIASNDQAYCWGSNSSGRLGDNTTIDKSIPTAVNTSGALAGLTIKSISLGSAHTCAIASNNQAYCWGSNDYGRLGDNTTTQRLIPVAVNTSGVLAGLTIKSISAGGSHTCAIASNNQAYCWGYNGNGQLGDNTTVNKSIPTAVNTSGVLAGLTIKSISAGGNSTCAIASNDQMYCWGDNSGGLGDGTIVDKSIPTAVNTSGALAGLTIKSISLGSAHTCAIASNDQAYCWGYNHYGQLGDNTTYDKTLPNAVSTSGALAGLTIKSIFTGNYYTCVIASNNQAYCWGDNSSGQLGDNTTTQRLVPVAVDTSGALAALTFKSIPAGNSHTCAIVSNNQVYCWGDNKYGQLGVSRIFSINSPLKSQSVIETSPPTLKWFSY